MSGNKSSRKSLVATQHPIAKVLGITPVLPGESEAEYQNGLMATVAELGATSPMQIYLAEKIYECMWWMRRYESQKRMTLIRFMAAELESNNFISGISELEARVMETLQSNQFDKDFANLLAEQNYSLESLIQKAMDTCRDRFEKLDEMIALKAKTLAGFQGSYEVLVNRKVNAERMRLQNALLERDLNAIEAGPVNEHPNKPSTSKGQ